MSATTNTVLNNRNHLAVQGRFRVRMEHENSTNLLWQFDMGTADAPIEPGFTRIVEDLYTPEIGYGYESPLIRPFQLRDREDPLGFNLLRSIAATEGLVFRCDVPPGVYTVRLYCGDAATFHDDCFTYMNDTFVEKFDTQAHEFVVKEYEVNAPGGFIKIKLLDGHEYFAMGTDFYVSLCGVQIFSAGMNVPPLPVPDPPPPPPPPPIPPTSIGTQLVFGPPNTPVPSGYTLVPYTTVYGTGGRNFGWHPDALIADYDRGAEAPPAVRFFAQSFDMTFKIDGVTPGVYTIVITSGDIIAHDHFVALDYHFIERVDTPPNVPTVKTYTYNCYSGNLDIQLLGYGHEVSDESATMRFLTYTLTANPLPTLPFHQLYSFGKHHELPSPVPAGYTKVYADNIYSAEVGYGWLPGADHLEDRDQGRNSDYFLTNPLLVCLAIAYDATFKTLVPNGTYTVKTIHGDIGSPHDFFVYINGVLVDTLHTFTGQFVFNSYPNIVVADGVITVRVQETTEPSTNYAVIQAVEVFAQ